MGTTEFSVRWKDHSTTLSSVCKHLLNDNFLVDCTIAAEGQCLKAHRLILSACSPYFQMLFRQENEKHPIVFLKDTKFDELQAIIDFIYHGEVQISEDRLESFLHIAESLQIKGLNDAAENNTRKQKVKQALCDSSDGPFSRCFSPNNNKSPLDPCANYAEKIPYADSESEMDQPNDSSENTSPYKVPCPSEVCPSSVEPSASLRSLLEDSDTSYLKLNLSVESKQQSSSTTEELSPHMKQSVKSEQSFETTTMDPKYEEMDDTSDATMPDYSENDSQPAHDQSTPVYSEQNVTNQFPGVAPAFVDNSQPPAAEHSYITPGLPGHSVSPGFGMPRGVEVRRVWRRPGTGGAGWHPPKEHPCPACPKVFGAPSQLEVHLRRHTGERPFRCAVCAAGFSQNGHLTAHMRRHTGERPYKCELCGAAFSESNNLTRHIRSHTGEKPYECADCPCRFTTSCQLRVHRRRHHQSELPPPPPPQLMFA